MADHKSTSKQPEDSKLSKVKQWFGIGSGKTASIKVKPVEPHSRQLTVTHELLKEISAGSPANQRLRTIRELCEDVQCRRLEENAVEVLWLTLQDLVNPKTSAEDRHVVLRFFACLIQGQYEYLGITRAQFFRLIKSLTAQEDLLARIELFSVLSKDGKDLLYFEEETGAFLLEWMETLIQSPCVSAFLTVLINVIKFNAAYLDEEVMAGIISHTCGVVSVTSKEEDVELCLRLMDTTVCYSYLPSGTLYIVVVCLCKVVGIDKFCQDAWSKRWFVCGGDRQNSSSNGSVMMRGAVFFLGMALWGSKRVSSLKHSPTAVLPSFHQALVWGDSSLVAYEIVLSIQRLVNKYGKDQQHVAWDLILDCVEALLRHIEKDGVSSKAALTSNVHDLLTSIETLHQQDHFNGCPERFFAIIETCADKRPESSILVLITHKAGSIRPPCDNWMSNLCHLVDKYFKHDVRTLVRLKVLDVLSRAVSTNRNLYQDEVLETVIVPYLSVIDTDTDRDVRTRAVQLLVDMASSCRSSRFIELVDVLKKIMNRTQSTKLLASEEGADKTSKAIYLEDIELAVKGLVQIFKIKMYVLPSAHALYAFETLTGHIGCHYQFMSLLHLGGAIRSSMFECFLALRADTMSRVGLPDESKPGHVLYSPYLVCSQQRCDAGESFSSSSSPAHSPVMVQLNTLLLPYSAAFKSVCTCLDKETDWLVLRLVLERLPSLLKNKSLVLATSPDDFSHFASRLCAMLSERNLPEKLLNCPHQFTKSDFHCYIFPVLTCLVSYHSMLDKARQRDLINCLEFGLVTKCARACVRALTVCCLEMCDIMLRQLPSVLLKLSQISATSTMAVPLMEFLSSLIHLPQLYSNFVEDQYMSIFAVALPYTNPFRYTHYTVSLAYHVVALWFVKCRLPFRKAFVPFIVKGLHANVLQQFEESVSQLQNQDSSDRSRTQSLNDEALRRRHQSAAAAARSRLLHPISSSPGMVHSTKIVNKQVKLDEVMQTFHRELIDTCVDMLARYTFSTYSTMPRRSPLTQFLLQGGQSQAWLLGKSIITITTSGGAQVNKAGLCDKCVAVARMASKTMEEAKLREKPADAVTPGSSRRRHKSAAIRPLSQAVPIKTLSQDDMHLLKTSSRDSAGGDNDEFDSMNLGEAKSTSLDSMSSSHEQLIGKDESEVKGRERRSSGLETRPEKIQAVDNLLMGLPQKQASEQSIFSSHVCNCWCTLWAEIHLRRPTGNLSWMMRIQNDLDVVELFPDFSLSDISSLFVGMAQAEKKSQINSSWLEESEYESLLQEHFSSEADDNEKATACMTPMQNEADPLKAKSLLSNDERKELSPESPINKEHHTPPSSHTSPTTVKKTPEPKSTSTSRYTDLKAQKSDRGSESGVKSGHMDGKRPSSVILGEASASVFQTAEPKKLSSLLTDGRSAVAGSKAGKEGSHGGINPSFLFLQLYNSHFFGSTDERPVLLPQSETVNRSVKLLDLIYPYETHKIGVIYIGPSQTGDQTAILSNVHGSCRYMSILEGLGSLVRLEDCKLDEIYLGGLHTDGSDGNFAYIWHAEFIQVVFHVATLMPNRESDPNCNAKKLHIGNDYVTIVYNDSGEEHKIGTIKGQFNYVNIVITPLDHGMNAVTVQTKEDIEDIIGHTDTKIVSDNNLAVLIRQMALHANLASTILQKQRSNPKDPYASNWLERFRHIKRLRSKVQQETKSGGEGHGCQGHSSASGHMPEDFTDCV